MRNYKDYHGLVLKILLSEYRDYDMQYLSTAYFAFDKARTSFDPDKGVMFTTYLAQCIRNEIVNMLRYNNAVVHVPLGARADNPITMTSFDTPINEDGHTLADLIASEQEDGDTDISDIKVPPKYTEAYNDIIDACRSGLPEKEFLRNKYGCNIIAHRKQSILTNLRKILRNNKNNIY